MKPFDLQEALNGAPVKLRSGQKAYVIGISKIATENGNSYIIGEYAGDLCNWSKNGKYWLSHESKFDIIGMWEEPKISVEDLPKPFKPRIGDEFFYLNDGVIRYFSSYVDSAVKLMRNGQCFRTKEDAQKWLDFMKSMME